MQIGGPSVLVSALFALPFTQAFCLSYVNRRPFGPLEADVLVGGRRNILVFRNRFDVGSIDCLYPVGERTGRLRWTRGRCSGGTSFVGF